MSKKLFLSSTCYDLDDIRSRIELWANCRFKTLLSDRTSFPVDPTMHRHDVCLSVAATADLLVLVIAGRFGALYYADKGISITWAEFRAASSNNVPIIVFVDRRVWEEREAHKRDGSAQFTVTKDLRTFTFLDEIQAHARGYWMEFYDGAEDILVRLNALTDLFPFRLSLDTKGVRREGKSIIAKSLSPETQHHIRHTVGDEELLSEDSILWALQAIPLDAQVTDSPPLSLHGFSVLVSNVCAEGAVVRASPLGEAVREELEFAFALALL